jgi:ornithine carbamoyltransferase
VKDLLSIHDLTAEEIEAIFALAADLKARQQRGVPHPLLTRKTLAMIFEKPSLRTRVTFEVGMTQLGGHAIYLTPADIRLGQRETVQDAARNLERWVDAIMARTFSHQMVEKLAEHASIPVINGLTDRLHPCQILTDIFTVRERRDDVRGLKVAYVGDGNNVCNSWCFGAAKTGIHLAVACPKGYEPDEEVWRKATEDAAASGASLALGHDPMEVVRDAHVIYTDVWASMGQEEEHAQRLRDFQGFQVDGRLVERARPDVLVMHCLPAHRGEEIADEVIDGPHSIVFDEAENRLHVQKAIMVLLMAPEAVTPAA